MAVFVRPLNDTMCDNQCEEEIESLPLPKGWSKTVRHAVLNVICIVRVAMLAGRCLGRLSGAAAPSLPSDVGLINTGYSLSATCDHLLPTCCCSVRLLTRGGTAAAS